MHSINGLVLNAVDDAAKPAAPPAPQVALQAPPAPQVALQAPPARQTQSTSFRHMLSDGYYVPEQFDY